MKALAGIIVTAGVLLAAGGAYVARRITAASFARRYPLRLLGVVRSSDGAPMVLVDGADAPTPDGHYSLRLAAPAGAAERIVPVGARAPFSGADRNGWAINPADASALNEARRASWGGVMFESPRAAGLAARDVSIPTPAGAAPAWLISPSSPSGVWAIHVHGLGSGREGTLRGVLAAQRQHMTSLVVTYRNGAGGPRTRGGRSTLGVGETSDVVSAIAYARESGATRVVLFGWSMGAAICLRAAHDPSGAGLVGALVLESPIIDWRAAIRANLRHAHLPAQALTAAEPWLQRRTLARLIGLTQPISLDSLDWISRAKELVTPTLIVHGSADWSAPIGASRELAARNAHVQLEEFTAGHTLTWNSDPERWDELVDAWLERHGGPAAPRM